MKKVLFFIFWISFILTTAMFSEDQEFDFRNTNWGMTIEQVRVSEGSREAQIVKDDKIVYIDTISNRTFGVYYHFIDNKLVRGGYALLEKHTNRNLYIQDYNDMKELLINKYGEPSDKWRDGKNYSKQVWLDDLYKDDPKDWGMAICLGHLVYQLCWETPKSEIASKLNGDNYKIWLNIQYFSKEFKELREKETEGQSKDKL